MTDLWVELKVPPKPVVIALNHPIFYGLYVNSDIEETIACGRSVIVHMIKMTYISQEPPFCKCNLVFNLGDAIRGNH